MKFKYIIILLLAVYSCISITSDEILGTWKSINKGKEGYSIVIKRSYGSSIVVEIETIHYQNCKSTISLNGNLIKLQVAPSPDIIYSQKEQTLQFDGLIFKKQLHSNSVLQNNR